jgi:hypothetical protein
MLLSRMGLFDIFKHPRRCDEPPRGGDPRLHGRWVLVRCDDPSMEFEEGDTMEFTADGKLTHTINHPEDPSVMKDGYQADGSEIVFDDSPLRTRYEFDDQGQLVLELLGSGQWYRRQSADAG